MLRPGTKVERAAEPEREMGRMGRMGGAAKFGLDIGSLTRTRFNEAPLSQGHFTIESGSFTTKGTKNTWGSKHWDFLRARS